MSSSAAAAGSGFTPITPHRSFDSRLLYDSKLARGEYDDIDVYTDLQNVDRLPGNANAVTYNLTLTETELRGNLALYPAGQPFPGVSSVNWWDSGFDHYSP